MTVGTTPVATYLLEHLTLDLIDATGMAPFIPWNETVAENIRHVYWDYDFSLAEVTEMCRATLPTQSDFTQDDAEEEEVLDLIVEVRYDGHFIKWIDEL